MKVHAVVFMNVLRMIANKVDVFHSIMVDAVEIRTTFSHWPNVKEHAKLFKSELHFINLK